ncbi:MAG: cation diffusion facilitator family transporter [Actinomycetota bacterium]
MTRAKRLIAALILNVFIVGVEVVWGFAGHSVGLLADAGHNLTDVIALGVALFAVRLVQRPPDVHRSFGYHRSSILAAQANAASVIAVSALVGYEAVRRLINPVSVHGLTVLVVASVALVVNLVAALLLRDGSKDLNMRAALLHMSADAATSLGVGIAGTVIFLTKRNLWLDPAASLVIGAVIIWQAWRLLRTTTDVLLESTPRDLDSAALETAIARVSGIESVHDLHVWSLSSEVNALSAHLILAGHPTLEEAQQVGIKVKRTISEPFRIAHATFELECESCVDDGSWCAIGNHATSLKL